MALQYLFCISMVEIKCSHLNILDIQDYNFFIKMTSSKVLSHNTTLNMMTLSL